MSTVKKICTLDRLRLQVKKLRSTGKKIGFTNGTFDILHAGHVQYLEKAKDAAGILIVGVNSDSSVKAYKSPDRPINPQKDRMRVLAGLACVDYVVLFNDPTPIKLIESLRPDYLVKGADWKVSQIAGAAEVLSWGGRVIRIPLLTGRSSTRIIDILRKL